MARIPVKKMLQSAASLLASVLISALLLCGCSGGGKEATVTQPLALTTVTGGLLKLGAVGTAADTIAGIDMTVNLPAGVTVDADPNSGEAAAGTVTVSGAAAKGSSGLVAAKYSPATAGASARLHIVLISSAGFGPGEFVTVRFNLAAGTSFPPLNAFAIAGFSAKGLDSSTLSGITGTVLSADASGNPAAGKQVKSQVVVNGTLPFYLTMMVDTPTKNSSQTISGTVDRGLIPVINTSPAATVSNLTVANGSWSALISGLVEGANIITCNATDPLTNETASVSATIILDTMKPDLKVDAAVYGTKSYFKVIGGTVDDPPYHIVYMDVNCPSATVELVSVAVPNWSAMIKDYSHGDNVCTVTATDLAGNHSSKDVHIYYDDLAPDLVIYFDEYFKYGTSLNLYGTVESGITPVVTVNGNPYAGTLTVNGLNWNCPVSGLTEGANTITVTATDSYGNVSTRTAIVYAVVAYGNFGGYKQPTVADAIRALRYAIGIEIPNKLDLLYGDLYVDNVIDLADAILILEKAVGL